MTNRNGVVQDNNAALEVPLLTGNGIRVDLPTDPIAGKSCFRLCIAKDDLVLAGDSTTLLFL